MIHAHGGLLVLLVALGGGALLGNVGVAAVAGMLRKTDFRDSSPTEQVWLAFAGLVTPALLSALSVVAVLTVPLFSLLDPSLDHCTTNSNAPHICFVHGTFGFSSAWEAVGVWALLISLFFALTKECLRIWRAHLTAVALVGNICRSDVDWTDDETPYAFTVAFYFPLQSTPTTTWPATIFTPPKNRFPYEHDASKVDWQKKTYQCSVFTRVGVDRERRYPFGSRGNLDKSIRQKTCPR